MTDAEFTVRFHPFHTPLLFIPDVVLVSHFIIGRPFTTMVLCRLQSLWALAPTRSSKPHLLDHYLRSLGVKAVLTLGLP